MSRLHDRNAPDYAELVAQFFTACVLKDCSVMLSLRALSAAADVDVAALDCVALPDADAAADGSACRRFAVCAVVIDLDDKSHHSVEHYDAIDCRIVDAFRRAALHDDSLNSKRCGDRPE